MNTFFFVLLAILCFASMLASAIAVRIAAQATESPQTDVALFASKLRSIELSQVETQEALSQLANKVKMIRVRNTINHTRDEEPATGSVKDQLRRKAGLVAGRPANHREQ